MAVLTVRQARIRRHKRVRKNVQGTAERPRLVVRLVVDDPEEIDVRRVRALVAAARPAHIPVEIEVVKS